MNKFRTLHADEIDCRISQIDKNWCSLLLYKDARCDMNILDEAVGPLDWKREHTRDNANCVVSIWDKEKKQWVSKEDTGKESYSEKEKGLASDSFKRACFNWGIGRELYTAPTIFITPKKEMIKKGKTSEFFEKEKGGYTTKTRFHVELIECEIQNLIIRDDKNNIRFEQLTKDKEKLLLNKCKTLRELIAKYEEKNEKFNRENLYKGYGVTSDSQLTFKQIDEIIEILKRKLSDGS